MFRVTDLRAPKPWYKKIGLIEVMITIALVGILALVIAGAYYNAKCRRWQVVPGSLECITIGYTTTCEPKKACVDYGD